MRVGSFKLVATGVRYCVNHHGIANEDEDRCDFGRDPLANEPQACKLRQLVYRAKRVKS